ncbi:MAG: translation initiation factor IF-1 [Candidatus Kerfeldbacteria bacterium]|nr:translation initiation factor IF-1 [Candidatus Kerfeldbacteria bacterium]
MPKKRRVFRPHRRKNAHKTDEERLPPSPKQGFLQVEGVVEELLPSTMFRVKLQSSHTILTHLAGRMRLHKIRILPGDVVVVEMTPYDLTKGRIVFRK